MDTDKGYAIRTKTSMSHERAVASAREALQHKGYGVLSELDIQTKLDEKLGVQREPYTILGACNPPLANRGLEAEPEFGTLLPCNVVVYVQDGATHVAAVEPRTMLSVVDNADLGQIAARMREDLEAVG